MKKRVATFAYVILRGGAPTYELLVVRRSPKDRYFPDMWGLPAGTLRKRESYEQAIARTAKGRLGVEVEVLGERAAGTSDRGTHVVVMRLFEARIVTGTPEVRDVNPDGHGYTEARWAGPDVLLPARERGSLCCRLVESWLQTRAVNPVVQTRHLMSEANGP
jgi:ADP-ribose pyrophosphatase YjhB (NUDIX family)